MNQPEDNYFNVLCANKECVDPMADDNCDFLEGESKRQWVIDTVLTYRMTSDEFFKQNNKKLRPSIYFVNTFSIFII